MRSVQYGATEEPLRSVRYERPRRPHSESGGHHYPVGAKVPGYAGFVPGMASGNLIAVGTPRAARQGLHPNSSTVAGAAWSMTDKAQRNIVLLQSSRVDPSRMLSAGNGVASNHHSTYVKDMPYSQDDSSNASCWEAM